LSYILDRRPIPPSGMGRLGLSVGGVAFGECLNQIGYFLIVDVLKGLSSISGCQHGIEGCDN
jgi:hypothetical protein